MKRRRSAFTELVGAGHRDETLARTVGPPVQKGSTVLLDRAADLYDESRPTYGRGGLATQQTLAHALGQLESAEHVRLFPSGLAAMTAAMTAVLRAGDEVLVTDAIYKPTRRFSERVLRRFGVEVRYHPARLEPEALIGLATPRTKLIVMESPGSLSLEMQDVPAIAHLARSRGILTLIDNTWAAGLLFKPLEHGVDLSAQSLTKYVGGHSDVFMGSVATRDPGLGKALDETVWDFGWSVSPDDAYLMLRGLRTLPARIARCGESGLQVAASLAGHPRVAEVLHPALPGSPDHALWKRDFAGTAGLFSFLLEPCPPEAVDRFLDSLELFGLGFSWGGFESLALACDPQLGVRLHEPPRRGPLVRLNIGLEDPADLIDDLARGLGTIEG
ncbi:MAG: cystathionine beta-lyase [Caulobacteraceae bacterium]|nr:cystathionine beta-lyase [Caulobacteraceae bacterium]